MEWFIVGIALLAVAVIAIATNISFTDFKKKQEVANNRMSQRISQGIERRQTEENDRNAAIVRALEALEGYRYAIVQVHDDVYGIWSILNVQTHSQRHLPTDNDDDNVRLGLDLEHRRYWFSNEYYQYVLLRHPAHLIPRKGVKLPSPRFEVLAGSVEGLVPDSLPDLTEAPALN